MPVPAPGSALSSLQAREELTTQDASPCISEPGGQRPETVARPKGSSATAACALLSTRPGRPRAGERWLPAVSHGQGKRDSPAQGLLDGARPHGLDPD